MNRLVRYLTLLGPVETQPRDTEAPPDPLPAEASPASTLDEDPHATETTSPQEGPVDAA